MSRFESSVDAEVQQRSVEYLSLCRKGPGMVDIMAEMPKFPERQVYFQPHCPSDLCIPWGTQQFFQIPLHGDLLVLQML